MIDAREEGESMILLITCVGVQLSLGRPGSEGGEQNDTWKYQYVILWQLLTLVFARLCIYL